MSETGIRQYGRSNLPGANSGVRLQNQDIALGAIQGRHNNFRHVYVAPTNQPMAQLKGATGGPPGGATGDTNVLHFTGAGGPAILEQHIKGLGQTLIVPTILSDGLEISGDQTDDEGMELYAGLTLRSPGVFQVGTDPAFFVRVRAVIDDVSGSDDFFIGFTRNSARAANLDDYTDMAGVNLISGQWKTETILNNAATVSTSLGASYVVADLGAFEVMVTVSAAGAVTYLVGTAGAMTAPPLAPAFTFDTGDIVTATVFLLNATDLTDSVRLRQFESGFVSNYLAS